MLLVGMMAVYSSQYMEMREGLATAAAYAETDAKEAKRKALELEWTGAEDRAALFRRHLSQN